MCADVCEKSVGGCLSLDGPAAVAVASLFDAEW